MTTDTQMETNTQPVHTTNDANMADVNQVKMRGTVNDVFLTKTVRGNHRFTFTVKMETHHIDMYGEETTAVVYMTCAAWGTAATLLSTRIKIGSRVQVIGELTVYTTLHNHYPSVTIYKTEIRTKNVEVIGFDSSYKPKAKVEFAITDDFSDL